MWCAYMCVAKTRQLSYEQLLCDLIFLRKCSSIIPDLLVISLHFVQVIMLRMFVSPSLKHQLSSCDFCDLESILISLQQTFRLAAAEV